MVAPSPASMPPPLDGVGCAGTFEPDGASAGGGAALLAAGGGGVDL